MEGWNPFGKVDMERGSFLKESSFNKQYGQKENKKEADQSDENNE